MEQLKVVIEGSGRHLHLTREHLDFLFGKDFELEVKSICHNPENLHRIQRLICRAKGTISGVSRVGPCRKATQVELSFPMQECWGITPNPGERRH